TPRSRAGAAPFGGRSRNGALVYDRGATGGLGVGAAAVAPGDGRYGSRESRGRHAREGTQVRGRGEREDRGVPGGAGQGRYTRHVWMTQTHALPRFDQSSCTS